MSISERIEKLSPSQRALLKKRLNDQLKGVTHQLGAEGEQRLIAYVVVSEMSTISAKDLRRFISGRIPEYMVPSKIIFIDSLPLAPNGKIDRNALAGTSEAINPEDEACFVPPRNLVELALAGIWAEVLEVDRISVDADFFELGGHSLLATKLISRLRDAFQLQLSFREILDASTVAGLAEVLRRDPDERAKIDKTAELLVRLAEMSDDEMESA